MAAGSFSSLKMKCASAIRRIPPPPWLYDRTNRPARYHPPPSFHLTINQLHRSTQRIPPLPTTAAEVRAASSNTFGP